MPHRHMIDEELFDRFVSNAVSEDKELSEDGTACLALVFLATDTPDLIRERAIEKLREIRAQTPEREEILQDVLRWAETGEDEQLDTAFAGRLKQVLTCTP